MRYYVFFFFLKINVFGIWSTFCLTHISFWAQPHSQCSVATRGQCLLHWTAQIIKILSSSEMLGFLFS